MQFEAGPASGQCPISPGDGVVFAASGWSRVFAAGEVVDGPDRSSRPRWGPRWPWVLKARIAVWVEKVEDGPKVADAGLPRSYGSGYLRITKDQYDTALEALRNAADRARHRDDRVDRG